MITKEAKIKGSGVEKYSFAAAGKGISLQSRGKQLDPTSEPNTLKEQGSKALKERAQDAA